MILAVDFALEPAVGFAGGFILVGGDGGHPALGLPAGGFGNGLADFLHQRAHVDVRRQHVMPVPGGVGHAVLVGVGGFPAAGEVQQLLRRADLVDLSVFVVRGRLRAQGDQGLRVPALLAPPALDLLGGGAGGQHGQGHGRGRAVCSRRYRFFGARAKRAVRGGPVFPGTGGEQPHDIPFQWNKRRARAQIMGLARPACVA